MRPPALTSALALAAALAGCAATPFEYRGPDEIKAGPGMFSGADGVFTLSSADAAAPAAVPPRESDEYREFLEWKRRRAEERAK